MYQEQKAIFIYCVSPVHMGAGTALGVIDNPIQRERHTDYPVFAGSGLKGAIRHDFWAQAQTMEDGRNADLLIRKVFGPAPEDGGSEHAGAVSFSDAQLVCFPVRSVKEAFVYTTSPTALARAARLLHLVGRGEAWGDLASLGLGQCLVADIGLCNEGRLPLEAFEFVAQEDDVVKTIAEDLARLVFLKDGAFKFFAERMKKALIVLNDEDFGYFVRNATIVEPHVRINDFTGTADDGGLFYTENLPPESVLVGVVMASDERRKEKDRLPAKEILAAVISGKDGLKGIEGRLVQVGGDATTGRGQVIFKSVGGN